MTDTYYLNSQPVNFLPSDFIGEGGEAEIYKFGSTFAVKLFKQESHPNFAHCPQLRRIAREKQIERQEKLRSFPKGLPPRLVLPDEFIFNKANSGDIVAYKMNLIEKAEPLMRLSDREYREKRRIGDKEIAEIFLQVHQTLEALHDRDVVVGDFNSLNVLVRSGIPYFIDTDSMQFGKFICSTYCGRYVDPLLCDDAQKRLLLAKAHNCESDWFAFAVMLFESLLYVHPFGGVFKPKDPSQRVGPEERVLRGISVFHPEVVYPSAAVPLLKLSNRLLSYFESVFVQKKREKFPEELLRLIAGKELLHGMPGNPAVPASAATAVPFQATAIQQLMLTEIFRTEGRILQVVVQNGRLRFVYFEEQKFYRENGRVLLSGDLTETLQFKICAEKTAVARDNSIFMLSPTQDPERFSVDLFRGLFPVFDCNERGCFWLDGGKIWHTEGSGQRLLQEAMPNQTRIFVSKNIGFGFYQAAQFKRAFIFDCEGSFKFNIAEHLVPANVLEFDCYFSDSTIWILSTRKQGADFVNSCVALDKQGRLLAKEEQVFSDDGWLSRIHGKTAASKRLNDDCSIDCLFSTINGGLAQIRIKEGRFVQDQIFDLPSLTLKDKLIYSEQGLYIWNSSAIRLLSSRPLAVTK